MKRFVEQAKVLELAEMLRTGRRFAKVERERIRFIGRGEEWQPIDETSVRALRVLVEYGGDRLMSTRATIAAIRLAEGYLPGEIFARNRP